MVSIVVVVEDRFPIVPVDVLPPLADEIEIANPVVVLETLPVKLN